MSIIICHTLWIIIGKQEVCMSEEIENFGMYKDLKSILFKVIGRIEANYKADFDDENQYVATGFKDIYFKKGNLIILASRPCIGKTSLALNILLNIVTKKKKAVGYITCGEFDEADITRKLLGFSSEIPLQKIKSANLKVEEVKKPEDIKKPSGSPKVEEVKKSLGI